MKVIAFVGSPRKGGNTDILVDTILDGARSKGAEVEKVHVYDLKFKGCIHCQTCKTKTDYCVLKDDVTELYEKIQTSDAVVFASPIYMGRITGTLKTFFDRWYSFIDANFNTRIKPGKKVVSATVYAAPKGLFDGEEEYVLEWCNRWGLETAGKLCVSDVIAKGDIKEREDVLAQARQIGEDLCQE